MLLRARTTTARSAWSPTGPAAGFPALGYPVPYAVATTSLALGGMALVMLVG